MARKPAKTPASFHDFSAYDALRIAQEDGREIEFKHPITGKGLGAFITMTGPDSSKQFEAKRWMVDRRTERANRGVTGPLTHEELAEEASGMLARMAVGWRDVQIDGKRPEFSVDAAEAFFKRFSFARDQVDAYAGSRGNFMNA